MDPLPSTILDFWFGDGTSTKGRPEGELLPPGGTARSAKGAPTGERAEWFRKDPAFDEAIRERFGAAVEAALGGAYGEWTATPRGTLALVLLLDQFTRNIYRNVPRMFAGDARALAIASAAVDRGDDRKLAPNERWFLYLPFEHAEDLRSQEQSLVLFGLLTAETGRAALLDWAKKHEEIIRRFGRYPHRNAVLGRESTPEEIAFLGEPGSRF